ncbi:hypothetical protein LZ496_08195 [Sphingomonas sp. NSE70-1]|uniref:Nickel/cobalt transporter regulator n=1 Tax=Sphingomonas caseinilyticus TaxID=2908205 RepID=A0ABT0RV40_9SPHN|nr:hypothetical protein [Sphingomonas caseinilyticus]MCL6698759.1 hypothetical protein [Sphingomonas caseinilyticus]
MLKWMLAAGAAALAIAAPSAAERGGGQGGQKDHSAHGQKADRGGGGQKARAQRGGDRQVNANRSGDRQRSHQTRSAQNDDRRGRGGDKVRSGNPDSDGGRNQARFANRQGDNHQGNQGNRRFEDRQGDNLQGSQGNRRFENGNWDRSNVRTVKVDRDLNRGNGKGRFAVVDGNDIVRVRDFNRGVVRVHDIDRDDVFVRRLGFGAGGCPPGLAKKAVACMPPGQAAKLIGQPLVVADRYGALAPVPLAMRNFYYDDDDYYYRYGGGYMYRVDRGDNLIASMIPLFGAALIGQPLQPSYVNSYYQPSYFNSFYPNSPYDCYRNGYGYVYETDCMTGMVENVIPNYGYGYGVGQMLPSSYGYYNLPYTYRSYFNDNDDYYYRYAPGAIYQVDRETALISSVAALLTNGLSVGQPLPVGYGAYNVPMAYRANYYDTPDVMYRYDNGYIYAVDPSTRMVNSVAYAIV